MALVRIDQSNFTSGEIDPRLYVRTDYAGYWKGAKQMRNFIVIPQGGFQRRFGTEYVDTATETNPTNCDLWTLQYNDNALYLLLVEASTITVYLENIPVATISTSYEAEDIQDLRYTQIENTIIVVNENFAPAQIVRTPNSANAITGIVEASNEITVTTALLTANAITGVDTTNNYIIITTPLVENSVFPIQFTTSSALPTTTPQIVAGVTYYAYVHTSTSLLIYATEYNACNNIDPFIISALGSSSNVFVIIPQVLPIQFTTSGALPTTSPQIYTGRDYFAQVTGPYSIQVFSTSSDAATDTNVYQVTAAGSSSHVVIQNTWAINTITFIYEPPYDFDNVNYSSFTFTPSATTGSVTLTSNTAVFTAAMAANGGGVFIGGNGTMRITGVTDSTHATGFTVQDFSSTNAIKGSLAFLGEPAWSNARGWPRTVGFYQQRLCFGGSTSIPNGVWLSYTNQAFNFDDTESLDDNAISYYTSSGVSNFVNAITSTESFVVHTNTGTYSTALGALSPATPTNFFLVEQNKDGCSGVQPVHIDNQIIYIDRSSNNVKNLQYDLIQSKYVLNNLSVPSSSLIVSPVDMASYADPEFTDGAYVFVVNGDGSLAVFQTLIEQNVAAWSLSTTAQTTTQGAFCHVASGINRSWFLVQRTIGSQTLIYIEELDFALYTDCSQTYTNLNSNVLCNLPFLENESVAQVSADGIYLGEFSVMEGKITLPVVALNVSVGLPINSVFEPLPLSTIVSANGSTGGTMYKPKHIRTFYINYYNTYGAYMNGTLIPSVDMRNFQLGVPIMPVSGVYQGTPMGDWDPFDPYANTLSISINEPFPATFIGISYIVEM